MHRVIGNLNAPKMSEFAEKTFICKLFNKGTCKFEKQNEHMNKGITYQHYCSYCYSSAGKKYDHPKIKCHRLRKDTKKSTENQNV